MASHGQQALNKQQKLNTTLQIMTPDEMRGRVLSI